MPAVCALGGVEAGVEAVAVEGLAAVEPVVEGVAVGEAAVGRGVVFAAFSVHPPTHRRATARISSPTRAYA